METTFPFYQQAVLRALLTQGPLCLGNLQQQICGPRKRVEEAVSELLVCGAIEPCPSEDPVWPRYRVCKRPGAQEQLLIEEDVQEIRQAVLHLLREGLVTTQVYREVADALAQVQERVRRVIKQGA